MDIVECLDEYINDNDIQKLEDVDEATDSLAEFESIVARFKASYTELKIAMGNEYQRTYEGREQNKEKARKYICDLKARTRELNKSGERSRKIASC